MVAFYNHARLDAVIGVKIPLVILFVLGYHMDVEHPLLRMQVPLRAQTECDRKFDRVITGV